MRDWLDGLLAVLLAPTCAACAVPLPHPTRGCVCATCWQQIVLTTPPLCTRCGTHLAGPAATTLCAACLRTDSPIAQARAIGPYGGALRDIVHALKYDARRSLARPLGALMRNAGAPLLEVSAAAVPVPLHPRRERTRGFNQAADLARHLQLPVVSALVRVRPTDTQTALPALQRHANVAGAFRATRHAATLAGRSVILVDDVRTTGATLDACAAVLADAGVREVFALTAARVESPAP